jgi:hypothetical protein
MSFLLRVGFLGLFCLLAPAAAEAARWVYEPVSDEADGQLVNRAVWQSKPSDDTVDDLLLNLGLTGGSRYEDCLIFAAPNLVQGASLHDVRIRVNMQGGPVTSPLDVTISAALSASPDSVPGAARFALPRTQTRLTWSISVPWDSSGQREVKWVETPNLARIVEEVIAQPGWNGSARKLGLFLEVDTLGGERCVRFDDTHPAWPQGGNAGVGPARLIVNETYYDAFWGKELLCRPTPTSVELNVIPHRVTLMLADYGTSPGSLGSSTPMGVGDHTLPIQLHLTGLTPDTRYYYRTRFRPPNSFVWQMGPTRSFVTLPLPGHETRLCVTTDIHVTNLEALGYTTMLNQLKLTLDVLPGYQPEGFHAWLDLGDLVVIRAQRLPFDIEEVEQRYREAREYIDRAGCWIPLLFIRGNHEEVDGWDYDGTPENTAIWSGQMLLKWFPPPLPDGFYSGNTNPFPDLGLPANYWACRIGDLRVRALDPYLYSPRRPHNGHGETGGTLNGWDWQIGDAQYEWLHDDLAADHAPYSFLALHHLTSCYTGAGEYYGRGGIEIAKWSVAGRASFEWGGEDETGQYVLPAQRPNWTHGAIHDMLAQLGNQVVLKGHDHFYGRQSLDGMIYLTMAKPDDTGEQTGDLWGWRWWCDYPDSLTTFQPNSGFLAIDAQADACTYSYVQTYPIIGIGTILDSFTVLPWTPQTSAGEVAVAPARTWIRQVAPNPTRDSSLIDFELGRRESVRLALYDASGRRVRDLLSADLEAGPHTAKWDGRDAAGRRVAAGVYFAKLETSRRVDSVKMIVVR